MTKREIKKHLLQYIGFIFPFFITMLFAIPLCLYLLLEEGSKGSKIRAIAFGTWGSIGICTMVVISKLIKIVLLLLDVATGCKTKTAHIIPGTPVMEISFKYDPTVTRFEYCNFKYPNGKKGFFLRDKNVCNYKLRRGNIHTAKMLKYSNYLLEVDVGKKDLATFGEDDITSNKL